MRGSLRVFARHGRGLAAIAHLAGQVAMTTSIERPRYDVEVRAPQVHKSRGIDTLYMSLPLPSTRVVHQVTDRGFVRL